MPVVVLIIGPALTSEPGVADAVLVEKINARAEAGEELLVSSGSDYDQAHLCPLTRGLGWHLRHG
jgi:hypothetical protein